MIGISSCLYANTVPRLVQLVEPTPPIAGETWVQRDEENELAAFILIHEGTVATWMRFFIHPGAESDAREILNGALVVAAARRGKPAYLCVRRYEGLLPSVLQAAGFHMWASQAVLVKHTVQHSKREMPKLAVGLENAGMPVSTPYTNYYRTETHDKQAPYLPDQEAVEAHRRKGTPVTVN